MEPDVHASGKLVAGRITSRSDIWKFPIGGSPVENTGAAVRVTRQTGHVRVPSVSPDVARSYSCRTAGATPTSGSPQQTDRRRARFTFETDREVAVGLPVWSPRGDLIAFVRSKPTQAELWGNQSGRQTTFANSCMRWRRVFGRRPLAGSLASGCQPGSDRETADDGGPAEFIRTGSGLEIPAIFLTGRPSFSSADALAAWACSGFVGTCGRVLRAGRARRSLECLTNDCLHGTCRS